MKVNYLISIFIILMLNKINAINCASIDEHVQSLKDNQIIILPTFRTTFNICVFLLNYKIFF